MDHDLNHQHGAQALADHPFPDTDLSFREVGYPFPEAEESVWEQEESSDEDRLAEERRVAREQRLKKEGRLAQEFKAAVKKRTYNGVHQLKVTVDRRGIRLEGRCETFYCKQLAQQAVMALTRKKLVNRIEVE